ncbi:MAG TPA: Crp/Fnr family transcriptional regulator [Candidatus Limnocylindrales bacterium]|nr:Crp/Fnr family transcriptional regulator [Candidatus Limnocylindrales bacterium]
MSQEKKLSTIEKVLFLKSIDFFADAAIEDLGRVAALTEEIGFDTGETIFREGELVDAIYFVVKGRVEVQRNGKRIREVAEKEAFAIVAALDQEPAVHTVIALEPVHALKLNTQDFHDMLSVDYELVRAVFRALCRIVREGR